MSASLVVVDVTEEGQIQDEFGSSSLQLFLHA
jgi:hypothetical protein